MNLKKISLLMLSILALAGCGESADVEKMKAGLTKSGMAAEQANCLAESMSSSMKGEIYNNLAGLLDSGMSEKAAIKKTRLKYGAEFRKSIKEARTTCAQ